MSKPTCAFAIPHDDRFNYLYQAIYAAVAIEAGFEPIRVLDLGRRGESIREAWDASSSDLAVVDLTNAGGQPYYYLALRQLQGKPTILTSQSADDIPVGFRSVPCIEYRVKDARWDKKLRQDLSNAIEAVSKDTSVAIFNPFDDSETPDADEVAKKVMGWSENENPEEESGWKMGFHTFIEESRKRRENKD